MRETSSGTGVLPLERENQTTRRRERKKFYATGEDFSLEQPVRKADTKGTKARGKASENPQRLFFGKQIVLEFTLPMLVLRNYVLEPEYVIKGL